MAAPPELVLLQLVNQAGDPGGTAASRPVLFSQGHSAVPILKSLSEAFLMWDVAPDGRARVLSLAGFLSVFATAAVLDEDVFPLAIEHHSFELNALVARVMRLVDSGHLAAGSYSSQPIFQNALFAATVARRTDPVMRVTAAQMVATEPYQVAADAVMGLVAPEPQGQEGENAVPPAPAVLQPAMIADDIGSAHFMHHVTFEHMVNSMGIPFLAFDVYFYFGSMVTRQMRIDERGLFRTLAESLLNALASAGALPSLTATSAAAPNRSFVSGSMVLQWLSENPFPVRLFKASQMDKINSRIGDVHDRVHFTAGTRAEAERVFKRRFLVALNDLPTLSEPALLGRLPPDEACDEFQRLAKVFCPGADFMAASTATNLEAMVLASRPKWSTAEHASFSPYQMVTYLIDAHRAALLLIQATPKEQRTGANDHREEDIGAAEYLRSDILAVTDTIRESPAFQAHATRVLKVWDDASIPPDIKPLVVLHSILAVPRRPDGIVDRSAWHVLIMQNCWYPRLTQAHHRVFKVIGLVHPHLWHYITQFSLFGKGLGAGSSTVQQRSLVFGEKVQKLMESGRMGDINYSNDIFCFLQSALDRVTRDPFPKEVTEQQFAQRRVLEDMHIFVFHLHEAIGLDPHASGSTAEILTEHKKALLDVACFNGDYDKITEGLHQSLTQLFNTYGLEYVRVMKSKDPDAIFESTLNKVGSTFYAETNARIKDTSEKAKDLYEYMPQLFGDGKQRKSKPGSSTVVVIIL